MVWVEEIGELGCRVRLGHGIQRVKPVAVNPQGIRLHHAAQQRVALPALVSQHVAVNNRLANVGQAAVADGRGETLINEKKCRYCHFFSLRLMDECMYQMEIYI